MFAAKKPQGYQMRPSADRTGQEAVSDKQEMDKKAFDLWKQTQSEIERSGQGNIISNNKEWYKATLDKWLTKFFKMHEPFHSSATLNSTDDQSVLKYISDARSQYSTMLTQKNPPVNVGLDAYKLHPVTPKINQAIQFGGVVYVFKGKQWVVKKTNRVAEKNIGAKLTKLAVKDLQSEKEPTAADYAPSGSQDTSTSEVPAFKRRKKIVKNVTR
jgi:hypothetical protein